MAVKKGTLSIDSENIFPIIKKWVYSDHDIFVRELVSNGCDAVTKLKKLDMMGEYELPEDYRAKIEVIVNPEEKTMKFIDNGLGMTAEEVEEYITQIAFSGATQFLEKYKDKTTEDDMIVTSDLDFILHSWWQMKFRSIHCLIKKEHLPYTGQVRAVRNMRCREEIKRQSEQRSRCF